MKVDAPKIASFPAGAFDCADPAGNAEAIDASVSCNLPNVESAASGGFTTGETRVLFQRAPRIVQRADVFALEYGISAPHTRF
jgi:hypothetical protein